MFEGEPVEEGALQDFRTLSLILGRRMPPPEPEESVLNALASWLERMAGAERLRELCAGS
jgi:hypothetical protein